MDSLSIILVTTQLLFTIVAGVYFYQCLRDRNHNKNLLEAESKEKLAHLQTMRNIKLTKPLSEKTRPDFLEEVIGQEEGIKALKAALCGSNPQHVLIYGPPGVGKTAAARLILEEAICSPNSPFEEDAEFVEIDATTLRFDERSIADPLLGSVHDPIYQGAGAYGPAGVPQPKEGAVTKANGGILFIDEIGELHPLQLNKLLKVLEDRVVYMQSSYYSKENKNIPRFIHEIFQKGFPADFRLIGATTRSPEEMPPALRSRCTELFFHSLKEEDIAAIAQNAIQKSGFTCQKEVVQKIKQYASNGRDTVNMVQTASSVAAMSHRRTIILEDMEWVIQSGRYSPLLHSHINLEDKVGVANGLAVYGSEKGFLLKIEAYAEKALRKGKGTLQVTGIIEEEEIKSPTGSMLRKSSATASVANVMTALSEELQIPVKDYHIHINFPGGMPIDGPSAGTAILTAVFSAITHKKVPASVALTGEVSIYGAVLPVGGVPRKIEGAKEAGANCVLIPEDNWQNLFYHVGVDVKTMANIKQMLCLLFGESIETIPSSSVAENSSQNILTAKGVS